MKEEKKTRASEAVRAFLVAARSGIIDRLGEKRGRIILFCVPIALIASILLIAAILPGLWPKKPDKADPAPAEESEEAEDQPKG